MTDVVEGLCCAEQHHCFLVRSSTYPVTSLNCDVPRRAETHKASAFWNERDIRPSPESDGRRPREHHASTFTMGRGFPSAFSFHTSPSSYTSFFQMGTFALRSLMAK